MKLGRKLAIHNERVDSFKTQDWAILSNVIKRLSKIKAKHWTLSLDFGKMLAAFKKSLSAEQKPQYVWYFYLKGEREMKAYGWQMQLFPFMNSLKGQRKAEWMWVEDRSMNRQGVSWGLTNL